VNQPDRRSLDSLAATRSTRGTETMITTLSEFLVALITIIVTPVVLLLIGNYIRKGHPSL